MTALDIAKEKELNSLVKVIEKKMEVNKVSWIYISALS